MSRFGAVLRLYLLRVTGYSQVKQAALAVGLLWGILGMMPQVYGQNGRPGGLTTAYNTDIVHWILADSADCTTDLCSPTSVLAAYGPTAFVNTLPAGGTFKYKSSGMGQNPSLTMTNKWLQVLRGATANSSSIFVVGKSPVNVANGQTDFRDLPAVLGGSRTGGSNNERFAITFNNGKLEYGDDASNGQAPLTTFNSFANKGFVAAISRDKGGSNDDIFVVNGTTNTFSSRNVNLDEFDSLMIGSQKDMGVRNYSGEVSEVIFYKRKLTVAEVDEVMSYLAIKYATTLAGAYQNLSGAGTVWPADAHFNRRIFGIAQENVSKLSQRLNVSSDDAGLMLIHGATIPNFVAQYPNYNSDTFGTAMTNSTYLMVGDDNGPATFTRNIGGVPNDLAANRLGRTFKVVETGTVGPVTLWFKQSVYTDLSGPGPFYFVYGTDSILGTAENFVLMTKVPGGASNDYYVQVDFPANQSSCFSITTASGFPLPGGVGKGLEFWVASDKKLSGPTTNISSLRDLSYNKHNLTLTGGTRSWAPAATQLNYHAILLGGALNRAWSTPAFKGQTIVTIGRGVGGTGTFDGWVGFDPDNGLREDASTLNLELQGGGNSNDWTNGGLGVLRRNGNPGPKALIDTYTIILGQAVAQNAAQQFFLGGYVTARNFTNYEFGEVLVYDRKLTANQMSNVETYLALKYGVTLQHAYTAHDSVSIYNIGSGPAYGTDIFGIGFSTNGNLAQRQSTSINQRSIVTISLGPIAASDSLNSAAFGNNNSFLIAGNDNSGTLCFTTDELNVTAEPGEHVRVQREWKYQMTGVWGPGQSLNFILESNNVNQVMPPLPNGSTQYYLYISNTPNFAAGTTTAYPMTPAGTKHTAVVTANLLPPGTGYFTFGTRLRPSDITQTGCEGSGKKIVIYRSHIGDLNVCSFLQLNGGLGTFDFIRGVTSTSTTYTAVDNAVGTACLDSITLIVPPIVTADNYSVLFDTITPCPGVPVHTNNADVMIDNLVITGGEVADVTWGTPPDTLFCVGEPNVTTTIGALCTIGKLELVTSVPAITSITQIMPDTTFGSPNFGTIVVSGSNAGWYKVRFVTRGGGSCRDTLFYSFRIRANTTTAISYTGSPYCGGASPQTVSLTGLAGGVYSIVPTTASAALNPSTGLLTVGSIVNPGNYAIVYTPPTGQCASGSSTSITVSSTIQANFHYLQDEYCTGPGFTGPFTVNQPTSGYFHIAPGSPGLANAISLDSTFGYINLGTTVADTYYVEYYVDTTVCHKDNRDTIIIHPTPNTAFTLGGSNGDTLCYAGGMVRLNPTGVGGVFKNYDGKLTLRAVSPFDSVRANGVLGGPFIVYYVNNDPKCPDSTGRGIYVHGLQTAVIVYPDTVFCKNEPNPIPQFLSGAAGGSFLSTPPGLVLNSSSGQITTATSNVGTYIIQYKTSDPVCFNTVNVDTIKIQAAPNPHFNLIPVTVCQDTGLLLIDTLPQLPIVNAFSVWSSGQLIPGAIVGNSLLSDTLAPGVSYEIRNIATRGACADTAYDYISTIARDVADIEFLPPIICIGDNNPHPFNFGTQGGTYSSVIPGDIVSSIDGTITIGSIRDTFLVRYVTSGTCKSTDTDSLIVAQFIDPTFSYNQVRYCVSDSMPANVPTVSNGGLGSFTYISSPTGLTLIMDSLGHVDLANSDPGIFDIKYTIDQSGSCKADAVESIEIVPHDTVSSFTLPYGPHCPSVQIAKPSFGLGSDTTGTFTGDSHLIFAIQDSGFVSLTQSSAGIHYITYHLPGACDDILEDTLEILLTDTSAFDYGLFQTAFCNGQPAVLPSLVASNVPGSFSISSLLSGVQPPPFVNSTGELLLPNSHVKGDFLVSHYTTGICPDTSTLVISISDIPANAGLRAEPEATICVGEDVKVIATGNASGFSFFRGNNPTVIGNLSEMVFTDVVDYDTIRVTFRTDFGCQISDTIYLTANPVPQDTVLHLPATINGNVPFSVTMGALTDETYMTWVLDDILGAITFPQDQGHTDTINAGDSTLITQTIQVQFDFDPAQFTYIVTPWANGCRGEERRITIKVNPNGRDIFVPQVFTPDGNGRNETWQVQWRDGIKPELYTIKLYNEAGAQVYLMHPLNPDWNGAGLPDGVYWYLLLNEKNELMEAAGLTIRSKP